MRLRLGGPEVALAAGALLLCLMPGCTKVAFVTPNPPGSSRAEPKPEPRPGPPPLPDPARAGGLAPEAPGAEELPSGDTGVQAEPAEDDLDFADAFGEPEEGSAKQIAMMVPPVAPEPPSEASLQPGTVSPSPPVVPSTMARVLVRSGLATAILYAVDTVDIRARNARGRTPFARGRLALARQRSAPGIRLSLSTGKEVDVLLPCTLMARAAHNYFELGDDAYRGSMIVADDGKGGMAFVNSVDVEEYLRGVVPLEIGRRSREEIEAVKAQAVAARTYAYRRIAERRAERYDLLSTVADQVYGGVKAEEPVSDRAVAQTRGIVLAYGDSLVLAYYHSTCGGRTAGIEDVWAKPPQPYLLPASDTGPDGKAYCAISRYFLWKETWTTARLSVIVTRYAPEAFPGLPRVAGTLRGFSIEERYACGRVKTCVLATTRGTFEYGGDKIRFLLRRDIAGAPILRSAWFRVLSAGRKEITLEGRGYGHGVGMCQMGAIGRARAGQTFSDILQAYYTGARLVTISEGKQRK